MYILTTNSRSYPGTHQKVIIFQQVDDITQMPIGQALEIGVDVFHNAVIRVDFEAHTFTVLGKESDLNPAASGIISLEALRARRAA